MGEQRENHWNKTPLFAPSRFDVFMVFIVISLLGYYLYQTLIYHLKALTKMNLLVLKLSH